MNGTRAGRQGVARAAQLDFRAASILFRKAEFVRLCSVRLWRSLLIYLGFDRSCVPPAHGARKSLQNLPHSR